MGVITTSWKKWKRNRTGVIRKGKLPVRTDGEFFFAVDPGNCRFKKEVNREKIQARMKYRARGFARFSRVITVSTTKYLEELILNQKKQHGSLIRVVFVAALMTAFIGLAWFQGCAKPVAPEEKATKLDIVIQYDTDIGKVPFTVAFKIKQAGGTDSAKYAWNFDDGHSSSDKEPSHEFTEEKKHTVSLTVTDGGESITRDVTIYGQGDIAPVGNWRIDNAGWEDERWLIGNTSISYLSGTSPSGPWYTNYTADVVNYNNYRLNGETEIAGNVTTTTNGGHAVIKFTYCKNAGWGAAGKYSIFRWSDGTAANKKNLTQGYKSANAQWDNTVYDTADEAMIQVTKANGFFGNASKDAEKE